MAYQGVLATHTAGGAVNSGAYTAVPFATENHDTDSFHDLVTNNSRLTVPAGLGGYYKIYCNVTFTSGSSTNFIGIRIRVNGGTVYAYAEHNPGNSQNRTLSLELVLNLSVADYVEVEAIATSANFATTAGENFFGMYKVLA